MTATQTVQTVFHLLPRCVFMVGLIWISLPAATFSASPNPGYHITEFQIANGLPRFDGVRFQIFDDENTPEIRSSRILARYQDQDEVLWIGTDGGGVTQYRDGHFQTVSDKTLSKVSVNALTGAGDMLWIGTVDGNVVQFDREKSTVLDRGNLRLSGNVSVVADRARNIWVATSEYLGLVESNHFHVIYQETNASIEITPAHKGGVWVARQGHLELHRMQETPMDLGLMPLPKSDMIDDD